MGRDKRAQPGWLGKSTERAEEITSEFESDLKSIAVRAAKHEGCERVLEKHVDDAFSSLRRFGLRSVPWWRLPGLESTIGAFLIGILWSVPDVVGIFSLSENAAFSWNIGLIAAFAIVGGVLLAIGFIKQSPLS